MAKILKRLSNFWNLLWNLGGRFPVKALTVLIDAGWYKGRSWEPERIADFLAGFDTAFPPAAVRVLSEFGGLNIGRGGRLISFGFVDEHLRASRKVVRELIGEPLFPVGRTNIFEDDGLSVLVDESGRIYVDGATGHTPPEDYRLDLIETDIDRFLSLLLAGKRVPEKQSWYYTQSDLE